MTAPPDSASHADQTRRPTGAADSNDTVDLAASVAGVVDAALGVGVSLARVVAQATAPGATVSVPADTPPIQAIVRYGVTAVGNVAQALMAGARSVGGGKAASAFSSAFGSPAGTASNASTAGAARTPTGPKVQAGSVLRVPLSVENPSERPMLGLTPVLRAVRDADGDDASDRLPAAAVAFFPAQFDVAPHDFEKLVVQVTVPPDMPAGRCELVLALGADEPDLTMGFVVLRG